MKVRGKKAGLVLLRAPQVTASTPEPSEPLVVPDDLQLGIAAVALSTGYSEEEVLRFMLEEQIGRSRHSA